MGRRPMWRSAGRALEIARRRVRAGAMCMSKELVSADATTSHTVVGQDADSQKATGSSRSIPHAWLIWVAALLAALWFVFFALLFLAIGKI